MKLLSLRNLPKKFNAPADKTVTGNGIHQSPACKADIKISLLRKAKIQMRFMVSFLALSLIPLFILGILAVTMSARAVEDKIKSYSSELLKVTGENLDIKTSRILEVNKEVVLSDLIQKDLPIFDQMEAMVRNQKKNDIERYMTNKFITDSHVICSIIMAGEDKIFKYGPTNMLSSEQWKEIYDRVEALGGSARDIKTLSLGLKVDNKNVILYANNITNALTNEPMGVMATIIDEKYLSDGYRDVQIAEGSHVFVLDHEGNRISSVDSGEVGEAVADGNLLSQIKRSAQENQSYRYDQTLIASRVLHPSGWYLVSQIPYSYLHRESNSIRSYAIGFIVLCLFLSFAAAWLITKSITHPLRKLSDAMRKASSGDISLTVRDGNRDEIGQLFECFNKMLNDIRSLVMKVRVSAKQVLDGASEIAASANHSFAFSEQIAHAVHQIAEGASNQAADSVKSVQHMGALSNDIRQVGNIMKDVTHSLGQTKTMNEDVQKHVGLLNEKALETSEITRSVVNDIQELNNSMREIGKITKMIASISDQTNLLSLNASIEAARAGEAGKGFAVVAGEVKKLSEQSRNASLTIGALLESIMKKTQGIAVQAGSAIKIVDEQTRAVKAANGSFSGIFGAMDNIIHLLNAMAACVEKMYMSRDQAAGAMENISAVSEEFAATAQEVSSHAEVQIAGSGKLAELARQINGLALELDRMIASFKTEA